MTLDDIYAKLEELQNKLSELKNFDYEAINIKNTGNLVVDKDGNPLKVNYAKNSSTINNKTYDEFVSEMKSYLKPLVDDIKVQLEKQNSEKPVGANYIKDWTQLEIDQSQDLQIITLDTLEFVPNYLEILVQVDDCQNKNGGSNGTITQIPPIGISIDGIPFTKSDNSKLKNYSGWWIENNQIKAYFKKANFPQWVGNCQTLKYKIYAWR